MPSIPWGKVLVAVNVVVLVALAVFGSDWWIRYRIVQTVNQYHALIEPRLNRPLPVPAVPPVAPK